MLAEIGMSGQAEGQPVLGELLGQFRLVQHPPVVLWILGRSA